MIDRSSCPAVERDAERMSGACLFSGTRVPVAALFENLADGASVEQFLEWFPGVTAEQERAVLEQAGPGLRPQRSNAIAALHPFARSFMYSSGTRLRKPPNACGS